MWLFSEEESDQRVFNLYIFALYSSLVSTPRRAQWSDAALLGVVRALPALVALDLRCAETCKHSTAPVQTALNRVNHRQQNFGQSMH
jgi:hypothetical protein